MRITLFLIVTIVVVFLLRLGLWRKRLVSAYRYAPRHKQMELRDVWTPRVAR